MNEIETKWKVKHWKFKLIQVTVWKVEHNQPFGIKNKNWDNFENGIKFFFFINLLFGTTGKWNNSFSYK